LFFLCGVWVFKKKNPPPPPPKKKPGGGVPFTLS
jgi:hypothetical protein